MNRPDPAKSFPEISEGTLFGIPVGQPLHLAVWDFRCRSCGYGRSRSFLTLLAGSNYQVIDGKYHREWRHVGQGICGCSPTVWLPDGPVPESLN